MCERSVVYLRRGRHQERLGGARPAAGRQKRAGEKTSEWRTIAPLPAGVETGNGSGSSAELEMGRIHLARRSVAGRSAVLRTHFDVGQTIPA